MKFKVITVGAAIFISMPTHGSTNRVGNGGDVEVCYDQKKRDLKLDRNLQVISVQLLDFQETDRLMNDFGDKSYEAILEQVLVDLQKVNPKLGSQYLKRSKSIQNEITYRIENLVDIRDSKHFLTKSNCGIEQIAIRKTDIAPGERRFIISQNYWSLLSNQGKAGLILHEIIYEHFYKLGEEDSLKARKFNSLLFSKEFSFYKSQDLQKFLEKLKVAVY